MRLDGVGERGEGEGGLACRLTLVAQLCCSPECFSVPFLTPTLEHVSRLRHSVPFPFLMILGADFSPPHSTIGFLEI
jgi:hypothetical protein